MIEVLGLIAALSGSAAAGGLEAGYAQARAILPARATAPQPPRVCSALDFGGVDWPPMLGADDRSALEIALNISGSFEGPDGWGTITDNFDGQGLSLGLLNQCLGQGSLQPLLIGLRDRHPEVLAARLSPEHLQALNEMLGRWRSAAAQEAVPTPLSKLDKPGEDGGLAPAGANQASVAWAKANLYRAGGEFVPSWKAELISLASSPEYVSFQIQAALENHRRALADEARVGVHDLRAYLFLYDVLVQNGGLYPQDLDDYAAWKAKHRSADGSASLEKLLELRIRHVRSRFAADVRSRKRAIIRGSGKVHGSPRNFPVEFCYDGAWPYPQ